MNFVGRRGEAEMPATVGRPETVKQIEEGTCRNFLLLTTK